MAQEIERKYLVTDAVLPLLQAGTAYVQGYLARSDRLAVRARIAGERAWLTIKSPGSGGAVPVRLEFEYAIPAADARSMLADLVEGPVIRKTRYCIRHAGSLWEVDVFDGDNRGLIVAEIELDSPDQEFERPPWLAQEVTADPRYLNANLALHPYRQW